MTIAEGTSGAVIFKKYATGVITPNAEPDPTVDPGTSGGQVLRRTTFNLSLSKDTYQSNEIRRDQQIGDFRHGVRRVQGTMNGELSPTTFADFFEAACRGTWAAAITASEADFTSVAADNTTSTITYAGGDPHTKGFRVGMVVRFTGMSDVDNNGKNFIITSMTGTNGRVWGVYPKPDTMSADTAFNVAQIGKSLYPPSSNHVYRKFAIEANHADLDYSRLFTECRIGGFNMQLPATGLSTVDFPVYGRNMKTFSAGAAPFFTAPTGETTTGLLASVNGLLLVNGVANGVITAVNFNVDRQLSGDAVVGQNVVPEIFTGRFNLTGQISALLDGGTLVDAFLNETEISLLLYLATTSDPATPALTVFVPRIKLGNAEINMQGEQGQSITAPFQGLKFAGATGIEATTLFMTDTTL